MGQTHINLVRSALPPNVVHMTDRLVANANEIHQTASLTYEQFLESLSTLSQLANKLSSGSGKQLIFYVKKGSADSMLWKSTVRIKCCKVNCVSNAIESTRILTLKQYIRLYNEISRHACFVSSLSSNNVEATDQSPTADHSIENATCLDASAIFSGLDVVVTEECYEKDGASKEEECVICMDRKSQIILPCAHAYCEQCIDAWQASHRNCPICRATVEHASDSWVLSEKPDAVEMMSDNSTDFVLKLIEKYPGATAADSDSD